jgi:hypothetical protein
VIEVTTFGETEFALSLIGVTTLAGNPPTETFNADTVAAER